MPALPPSHIQYVAMRDRGEVDGWRVRAHENLVSSRYLADRAPALLYPAVSRVYYACFQSACAELLVHDRRPNAQRHGDVWLAIDDLRPGTFFELQELHSWRRKADYATGVIPGDVIPGDGARALIAKYSTLARELGTT